MNTVFISNGYLVIHEGDGFYDTRESFLVDDVIGMIEEVGVKGGHVGWQLLYKQRDLKREFDFGRKHAHIMSKVKEFFKSGLLKGEVIVKLDVPTKCY